MNELTQNLQRSDAEIKASLEAQLKGDDRIVEDDITVEVTKGVARLSGTVPQYSDRLGAFQDAQLIPGVISVINGLEVVSPPEIDMPSDTDVEAACRTMLDSSASVRENDITIESNNGIVTLTGSVDAFWKSLRAETILGYVWGVRGIRNQLSVVPTTSISDQIIADSITTRLRRSSYVIPEKIEVEVADGMVTVRGTVPSWPAWDVVQQIVTSTPGAIAIDDQLAIAPEETTT